MKQIENDVLHVFLCFLEELDVFHMFYGICIVREFPVLSFFLYVPKYSLKFENPFSITGVWK